MTGTIVRTTRVRSLLDEWSLVLTAAEIQHSTATVDGHYELVVGTPIAPSVVALLRGYDEERRQRRRPRWTVADRSANVAWLVATAILIGQMWIGPAQHDSLSFSRGAARAVAIHSGELWRLATALTLHADAMHAISNTAAALLFLPPLCRLLGGGTAFALTLSSGMLATWINAYLRGAGYTGIGASTAIFAAVGLLAGLRLIRPAPEPLWRRLSPLGAALGILAMLGASPQTDVGAHLLGLVVGAAMGAVFASLRSAPMSARADRAVGLSGLAVLVAAWLVALAPA